MVPKEKLSVKGPIKSYAGVGSSGKKVHRVFCSECGSPIAHDPEAAPEIIAIKAGTLDSEIKKQLKPVCPRTMVIVPRFIIVNNLPSLGHRNLDRQQAPLLPGAPRQAFRPYA